MVQDEYCMLDDDDHHHEDKPAVNRFGGRRLEDSSDSGRCLQNDKRRSNYTIELPEEMVCEIFLRFPVKSLIRFRCVSKAFRGMIDSPTFIKKHDLQKLYRNCEQSSDDYAIIAHFRSSIKAINFSDDLKRAADLINLVHPPHYPENYDVDFADEKPIVYLGSCNGILVFQEEDEIGEPEMRWDVGNFDDDRCLLLWNPSNNTSKYTECPLPLPPRSHDCPIAISVGYDHVNDDYKVIYSILHSEPVLIFYSLRQDRWNTFHGEFPIGCPTPLLVGRNARYRSSKLSAICVSSAMHWLWKNPTDSSRYIVVFDLVSESFRSLSLPEIPRRLGMRPIRLLDFGGRLCVTFLQLRDDDDITSTPTVWVMENYGIETSWTPLYTGKRRLFCYFPNKEGHLLTINKKKLKWWNPVKHSFSKVDIKCGAQYEYVIYKRNLVRLDSL